MTTTEGAPRGWAVEELRRRGAWLLVMYFNGEVRGQIECETEKERSQWHKAITYLNSLIESD